MGASLGGFPELVLGRVEGLPMACLGEVTLVLACDKGWLGALVGDVGAG